MPSGPGEAWDPNFFFQSWQYTTGSYAKKNFEIFSAHLRYLPISSFLDRTQLAIFRIEYNAFSKAKFGNFQRLPILNIYLQTIIMSEKTDDTKRIGKIDFKSSSPTKLNEPMKKLVIEKSKI